MKRLHTFSIVLISLFAALTCVATMFLRIPSPTGGYLNLGDGIVLLSAFLLGPFYGMLSAGIGSALADVLSGYAVYAPGTLLIKGLAALAAAFVYRRLSGRCNLCSKNVLCDRRGLCDRRRMAVGGVCGEILMVLGYFAYTGICLSYGAGAAAEIPGNLAQGAAGIVVAVLLAPALMKNHEIREMLDHLR